VNKKNADKISHITLLSAAWCAKMKSETKVGYYDLHDGEDIIVKWLRSLMEITAEVECDNRYDCIDYRVNKIMNYVPVLGYNSPKFDMNFLINILHNLPNHLVESNIGNLVYFKQVMVMTTDWTYMKFLEAMNYVPPQTLDSFAKTFGDKKDLQKSLFTYDWFYMNVLNEIVPFEQQDFHSNLKNSDISEEVHKAYLVDWKEKRFQTRWDYLKYYNINDLMT
jgi:hypothetical protein